MREEEICQAVSKLFNTLFPARVIKADRGEIGVYEIEDGYSTNYKLSCCIHILCNENLAEYYTKLGESLETCIWYKIPTYIAVPYNYPYLNKLEPLVSAIKLPVGLILVYEDGKVDFAKPGLLKVQEWMF
jgi:hypothetical protein